MIAIIYILIAAVFAAFANFCMRRNLDGKGSVPGYLFFLYLSSLLISIVLSKEIFSLSFSSGMFATGSMVGFLNLLMMGLTGLALTLGPSGLTFAFQTSGAVFPAILLYLLFGTLYGFTISLNMIAGLFFVLVGLFWGALSENKQDKSWNIKWLLSALGIFFIQIFALTLMQWRCLNFSDYPAHSLIPFKCSPEQDAWFAPALFGTAFLIQTVITFVSKSSLTKRDLAFGLVGGVANGLTNAFLMMATIAATPIVKGVLFPSFAIGVIFLCNLWSTLLYQEKVNWWATLLCSGAIVLASI